MQFSDPSDQGDPAKAAVGPADEAWALDDQTGFMDGLGVVWRDSVLTGLEAIGAKVLFGGIEEVDETIWLATDVGLVDCHPRVDKGRPIRLELGVRPWSAVKDPSVSEEIIIAAGEPHLTAHLSVQSPRIDVTHSGRQRRAAFAGFVREALQRSEP